MAMDDAQRFDIKDYELYGDVRIWDGEIEEVAAKWPEHEMTTNVYGFIEDLRAVLDGIPADLRATAEIAFGSYTDRDGCSEGVVHVTYKRKATERELAIERLKRRRDTARERNWVRERVEELVERARREGLSPEAFGISVVDGGYTISAATSAEAAGLD